MNVILSNPLTATAYRQALRDVEDRFNKKTGSINREFMGDENVVADAFWETIQELEKEAR